MGAQITHPMADAIPYVTIHVSTDKGTKETTEPSPQSLQGDVITVLACSKEFIATKRIARTSGGEPLVENFKAGKFFNFTTLGVNDIESLSAYLTVLEIEPK